MTQNVGSILQKDCTEVDDQGSEEAGKETAHSAFEEV